MNQDGTRMGRTAAPLRGQGDTPADTMAARDEPPGQHEAAPPAERKGVARGGRMAAAPARVHWLRRTLDRHQHSRRR